MVVKSPHEAKIAGILKAELKKREITYNQLAIKLNTMGIPEKEANIRNKLARGKFSAAFLIQCLEAIGVYELNLK